AKAAIRFLYKRCSADVTVECQASCAQLACSAVYTLSASNPLPFGWSRRRWYDGQSFIGIMPKNVDRDVLIGEGRTVTPMTDARIEAFLADVLALEGEDRDAIREGVHVALADCGQIFKAREVNRRMKDKAAHACYAFCCARIVEEIRRRKGTATAEY